MAKQNLLLVDADLRSVRVLEVSLRKAGYNVASAGTAQDALGMLELSRPDLVLCDTRLPVMDGFEFIQEVRSRPELADIPLMILSSDVSVETKVRGLELGVEDYLTKPIYIKELLARVNIVLQRKRREGLERLDQGHKRKFSGSLSDMGVVDLLQAIDHSKKSGVLYLTSGQFDGAIYFCNGAPVDAEVGKLRGSRAIYRTLLWTDGTFEIDFREIDREDHVQNSMQAVLMEGLRRVDEWGRLLEQLPNLDSVFEVSDTQLIARLAEIPDQINSVLRQFDGQRSLWEIVDACEADDLETLGAVSKLYFEGLLYNTGRRSGELDAIEDALPPPMPELSDLPHISSGPPVITHTLAPAWPSVPGPDGQDSELSDDTLQLNIPATPKLPEGVKGSPSTEPKKRKSRKRKKRSGQPQPQAAKGDAEVREVDETVAEITPSTIAPPPDESEHGAIVPPEQSAAARAAQKANHEGPTLDLSPVRRPATPPPLRTSARPTVDAESSLRSTAPPSLEAETARRATEPPRAFRNEEESTETQVSLRGSLPPAPAASQAPRRTSPPPLPYVSKPPSPGFGSHRGATSPGFAAAPVDEETMAAAAEAISEAENIQQPLAADEDLDELSATHEALYEDELALGLPPGTDGNAAIDSELRTTASGWPAPPITDSNPAPDLASIPARDFESAVRAASLAPPPPETEPASTAPAPQGLSAPSGQAPVVSARAEAPDEVLQGAPDAEYRDDATSVSDRATTVSARADAPDEALQGAPDVYRADATELEETPAVSARAVATDEALPGAPDAEYRGDATGVSSRAPALSAPAAATTEVLDRTVETVYPGLAEELREAGLVSEPPLAASSTAPSMGSAAKRGEAERSDLGASTLQPPAAAPIGDTGEVYAADSTQPAAEPERELVVPAVAVASEPPGERRESAPISRDDAELIDVGALPLSAALPANDVVKPQSGVPARKENRSEVVGSDQAARGASAQSDAAPAPLTAAGSPSTEPGTQQSRPPLPSLRALTEEVSQRYSRGSMPPHTTGSEPPHRTTPSASDAPGTVATSLAPGDTASLNPTELPHTAAAASLAPGRATSLAPGDTASLKPAELPTAAAASLAPGGATSPAPSDTASLKAELPTAAAAAANLAPGRATSLAPGDTASLKAELPTAAAAAASLAPGGATSPAPGDTASLKPAELPPTAAAAASLAPGGVATSLAPGDTASLKPAEPPPTAAAAASLAPGGVATSLAPGDTASLKPAELPHTAAAQPSLSPGAVAAGGAASVTPSEPTSADSSKRFRAPVQRTAVPPRFAPDAAETPGAAATPSDAETGTREPDAHARAGELGAASARSPSAQAAAAPPDASQPADSGAADGATRATGDSSQKDASRIAAAESGRTLRAAGGASEASREGATEISAQVAGERAAAESDMEELAKAVGASKVEPSVRPPKSQRPKGSNVISFVPRKRGDSTAAGSSVRSPSQSTDASAAPGADAPSQATAPPKRRVPRWVQASGAAATVALAAAGLFALRARDIVPQGSLINAVPKAVETSQITPPSAAPANDQFDALRQQAQAIPGAQPQTQPTAQTAEHQGQAQQTPEPTAQTAERQAQSEGQPTAPQQTQPAGAQPGSSPQAQPSAAQPQAEEATPAQQVGAAEPAQKAGEREAPAPTERATSADAQASTEETLAKGRKLEQRGRKQDAINLYAKAVDQGHASSPLLSRMAFLYLNQGKNALAETAAKRAAEADETNSEAWIVLGAAQDALGKKQAAEQAYRNCAEKGQGQYVIECKRMLR